MPTFPSGSNTYVPELTGKLVVDFSRNITDFPLNNYVQIVPVTKQVGYYTKMTREEAGRILNANGANFAWPAGADRPKHNNETESFSFEPYGTKRYDYGFNLDRLAVEQASFDIKSHNAGQKAEQAMRFRTNKVVTAATTSGNYDSNNVSAVASIPGVSGEWEESTTARKDIKRSLDYAFEQILKSTLNGVKPDDVRVVISPYAARLISISQEIVDHLKGSPHALAELQGELPNRNALYGLPKKLYGYEIVVEDTYKVTTKKGAASATVTGVLANGTAFMCARPGSLVSERASEAPSFATHVLFMKEEMTVESRDDDWNRRHEHHIVEDFDVRVAAPAAGFLFTTVVN